MQASVPFARLLVTLAVVAGLVLPAPGWAQAAKKDKKKKAAPAAETEVEEITVTAQKREESVQEIPVSVTAISSEALADKGITSVADLGETARTCAS